MRQLALLLCLAACVGAALAADPVRIAIECEDMQGVEVGPAGFTPAWTFGTWGRDLHQNMIFGGPWASRMAAAVTDAGDTTSEVFRDIEVPRADRYKVWAKYECPPYFNYAFGLRIAPLGENGPGRPVFERTYGLRAAEKHYCFRNDLLAGDLYWTWGIDHDAAEGYEVDLPAGRYRVTLSKVPNVAPAGERSVDAILITTRLDTLSAPDYPRYPLLDELQQINHLYVRFTNTGAAPVTMDYNHWSHRPQYYYTMAKTELVRYYGADGQLLRNDRGEPLVIPSGVWNRPIAPGASSPWIDLGPTFTTENSAPLWAAATAVDAAGRALAAPPASVPFTLDLALTPGEAGIVKSFANSPAEPLLVVNVQPDLHRPEGREYTVTGREVYARMTRALEAIPRVGPVPRKLRLFGAIGYPTPGAPRADSPAFTAFADYSIALGLNTLNGLVSNPDLSDALIAHYRMRGVPFVELSGTYHHTQDAQFLAKQYLDPRIRPRFYYNSFGDEIGLPGIDLKDQALLAAFRAFVQARGVKPKDLGFKTLEEVKPLANLSRQAILGVGLQPTGDPQATLWTPGNDVPLKRLFWLTHLFIIERGIRDFAEKTKAMTELIGPHFKTSANLGGMHPFYWMHQASFIEAFRGRAMTLAWSEDYDYCQPEASRLAIEFQAAYLRAGAKYHDTPMMFYNMPHFPGNTGRHLVQNAVSLWGQGVKDLDFFCVGPDLFLTENYLHSRGGVETGAGIRRISGMAGNVEDALLPARTRPAKIAMLLSEASDVWELRGGTQNDVQPGSAVSNASQEERKAIWYALRHAGYQVDQLTEHDVADGRLKGYRVVYVCGRNLERRTAAALATWVRSGGVLCLTAGAARRDEYDEPLTALDAVVGRGRALTADDYGGPLRAKLELLQLAPKDQVMLTFPQAPAATFGALATMETFAVAKGAKVLGVYTSAKQPALVCRKSGRGWGFYTGTLPGQAFLRKALPLRVMGKGGPDSGFSHFEPTAFDPAAQAAILAPVRQANLPPETTSNYRNLVTSILDGPKATVVTLVNLNPPEQATVGHGRKLVALTLRGVRPAKGVSTAMKAGATVRNTKDGVTVYLTDLHDADVIVLEH